VQAAFNTNRFDTIRNAVIGANAPINTPFGVKPLIYADYTASGRSLSFIESYITQHVLPWYANTHTETSFTGAQSSKLREQARDEVRKAINASAQDKVIFCGAGATAAINKMMDILSLRMPNNGPNTASNEEPSQPPVIFIGPYEHHSNELPWRESCAEVVCIPLNACGQIDIAVLEQKLVQYKNTSLKIGSFSAASNVTGIISDVDGITAILAKHNALSFWDYAAAAPYITINMNGPTPIDAVFISPHKFIGGPGTPGILVVKEHLVKNAIPTVIGGGTVSYVTPTKHVYTTNIERREEGGTPAIVESVRAGLVFKLQQEVGLDAIKASEDAKVDTAMAFFASTPNIEVLGSQKAKRLSIFSLRFKHQDKELHYGFVTALLNDVFGIQARGGCSCAGPYGHRLLNMDKAYSAAIEKQVSNGNMILRPGWVRLNFNYFISQDEFNYILQALKLVAEHGWRLLPYYQLDSKTWSWRYQGQSLQLPSSLNAMSLLDADQVVSPINTNKNADIKEPNYDALLLDAAQILLKSRHQSTHYPITLDAPAEALRWFTLPQECLEAPASSQTESLAGVS
jgi:selenocysteine lyase/cysteine desulfurase